MPKLVVFDFDGTLANSFHAFLQVGNEIARRNRIPELTLEDVKALSGMSIKEKCRRVGLPLYKLPAVTAQVLANFRKYISSVPPMDGVRDMLTALKENGFSLAIVSSNSESNIRDWLRTQDFKLFDDVISSRGLLGKAKSIRKLLKLRSLRPDEVVYVGDEIRDIEACKETNVAMIAVTWGLDSQEVLKQGGPEHIVTSPAEIPSLVQAMREVRRE